MAAEVLSGAQAAGECKQFLKCESQAKKAHEVKREERLDTATWTEDDSFDWVELVACLQL